MDKRTPQGPGRPRTSRSVVTGASLSLTLRARLNELADRSGLSLAEVMRSAVEHSVRDPAWVAQILAPKPLPPLPALPGAAAA